MVCVYLHRNFNFNKGGMRAAMIAQWDSSLSVLPVARVQFPATAEYFKSRDVSLADRTLPTRPEPAWQKMA